MKFLLSSAVLLLTTLSTQAQSDSTKTEPKPDTIIVGGMIIINKKGKNTDTSGYSSDHDEFKVNINLSKRKKSRLTTSWLKVDLGFANYSDQTNYNSAAAKDYVRVTRPGEADFTESDLRLKAGKSINVNIWLVKQRYGLTRDSKLNARWGLMLESNNYRYETSNRYASGNRPYMYRDTISFKKNKLAADYLTVPLMLGFNSKPFGTNGFSLAAGVSVGYLYSSRSKQTGSARGKEKDRGGFDLEPFKFQYIGEIGIGAVKLYGSYSPNSIYKRGLDIRPFNIGFRLGEWN